MSIVPELFVMLQQKKSWKRPSRAPVVDGFVSREDD